MVKRVMASATKAAPVATARKVFATSTADDVM
jgi:hypothetical protein